MTVRIPIVPDEPEAGPSSIPASGRSFAADPDGGAVPDLADVVRRVRNARRIVVICGAGVSTAASIPDFRSAHGLFAGSKGHGIKDLFHVKSLSSPALLPEHHALLTDLCERTLSAQPTEFHKLLAALDADGRLLRCYTQNIDGLEERAGLRTGVPPARERSRRSKVERLQQLDDVSLSINSSVAASLAASTSESAVNTPSESGSEAVSSTVEHKPAPRCIPLHGLLKDMHCSLCSKTASLSDYLPLPASPISCPSCDLTSSLRSALSERQRRVGSLRASVVLYGEDHPEGELIGSVVERDLKGTGRKGEREGRVDMLLVAGTSLAIPGVKRIVKEMAKALSTRAATSVRDGKAPPVRTVLLNAEPPAKPAEWDGVFDVWLQGDVQKFAELVTDKSFALPVEPAPRNTTPRKKTTVEPAGVPPTPDSAAKKTPRAPRVRKASALADSDADTTPTKKRSRSGIPLTPRPTPPRRRAAKGSSASASASTSAKRQRVAARAKSRSVSPSPIPGYTSYSGQGQPCVDLPVHHKWHKPGPAFFMGPGDRALLSNEGGSPPPRRSAFIDLVVSPTETARARFSPPPPVY